MIRALVGLPGSGKSKRMAELAVQDILNGRTVYTNFRLRWDRVLMVAVRRAGGFDAAVHRYGLVPGLRGEQGCPVGWRAQLTRKLGRWRTVQTYADLEQLTVTHHANHDPATLYFDEAQGWFASRYFQLIPASALTFWSQHRKAGVDCWWASQRYGAVDIHLRELTAETWHCRHVDVRGRHLFLLQMEDMESPDRRRRIYRRLLTRLNEDLAACYDTFELLPSPIQAQLKEQHRRDQAGAVAARQRRTGPGRSSVRGARPG